MREALIISLFAAILAAPAAAQPATGMGALQYYVGGWSCVAGSTNQQSVKATSTYVADSGVLRQWVMVPAQGKMKTPYAFSAALTHDAKRHRYLQTSLDNGAG